MADDRRTDKVACAVCDAESEHVVILRAEERSPPDLDTRPGETLRSTMPHWVQRCPSCGYCAPDLADAPPRAARVVRSEGYRALLNESARPRLANEFLAASVVLESGAMFAEAGWQAVYAAWACDDARAVDAAESCRDRALELFEKARSVKQSVVEEPGGTEALFADLLRRCGRFDDAAARAGEGLDRAKDESVLRTLRYIALLATRGDRDAHSTAETTAAGAPS